MKNAGRCEGALCGVSALVRRCGPWFEPYVLGLVPDMLLLLAHKVSEVLHYSRVHVAVLLVIDGTSD